MHNECNECGADIYTDDHVDGVCAHCITDAAEAELEVIDLDDNSTVWIGSVSDFIEANAEDHETCSAVLELERYADGTFITWTGYAVREVKR